MQTIGQYRFDGYGAATKQDAHATVRPIAASNESVDDASFQDIQIVLNSGSSFTQNRDYYAKISVPQDINYDMSFNIQLVSNQDDANYQFLRTVEVKMGGTGKNAYTVVLYEDTAGNIKAMVPLPYPGSGAKGTKDFIYINEISERKTEYYIYDGSKFVRWEDHINSLKVTASWKHESGENYGVFEFTFRPMQDNFDAILLKMQRRTEDYNIQSTVNGQTVFGRMVDPSKVIVELYALNNLLQYMSTNEIPLDRIGVWSHPGLIMVINGEEIRVTASGFYELDSLPITSFCVVAPNEDNTNFFTVDYTYDTENM